ncbi:MAG: DUF1624 domain-containing protein [Oscillospiraceae bacterium]|nr:DUF1624 domain-containing protein [Oscillospiraceae bacterium]
MLSSIKKGGGESVEKKRYHLIDALRGLALANMVAMHFLYDVNVVYGREPDWYLRPGVRLWQQCICWSFILIAGFSFHFGRRNNLRRGLLLNVCGLVITAVTLLVLPSEAIWFGILNFMGCAILLTMALEKGLKKCRPGIGLAVCFLLFLILRRVDSGVIGLGPWQWRLPAGLYRFRILAPLGFPDPGFRSSDYFPMLPWYLLFLCGWFLFRLFERAPRIKRLAETKIPVLSALGRRTVWVYMLHQPVLMGICMLLFGR